MAKNILIFSTNYFPFVGGAEVAIKEITDRASRQGFPRQNSGQAGQSEFTFDMIVPKYTSSNKRFEKIGNINVYRVGIGIKLDKFFIPFLGYWKAKKLEKKNKYNVIWSMMASQASIAAAKFKKKFPDKRLVLTLQEGDEESYLKRYVFGNDFLYKLLIKPFYMKIFKVADHITAISNYLVNRARKNNPNIPITLVPNGVDAERFNIKKDISLKDSLGIRSDEKVVMTISRLVKKNGIETLVRAAANFPENTKLIIVGDGSERTSLESKVKSLKLKDSVVFVGEVKQADVSRYLSIADVFVRPSLSEGQGIAFLEAMASSVPVIATPVGGIVDFLIDGETGLFSNVEDSESISQNVKRLIENQDLVTRIKASSSKMIKAKYGWSMITKDFLNILVNK